VIFNPSFLGIFGEHF